MTASARPQATKPSRLSVRRVVLGSGALAGAVGSVIGVGSTLAGWFGGGPEGRVETLEIQSVRPLTYGGWRSHENAPTTGVTAADLKTPGKLVTFTLVTEGFDEDDVLPLRIIVHDVTPGRERDETIVADQARVRHGKDCGCADWVPVPPGRHRYYLELAVYPPGEIRGAPLKADQSGYFVSPPARRPSRSATS